MFFSIRIEEYLENGSGYQFLQIDSADLYVAKFNPLRGGAPVEVPDIIKNSTSVLDILSKDNKCFYYCLLAAKHPGLSHQNRVKTYEPYFNDIKMGKVKFPVKITDIKIVEELNNISINVFEWNCEDENDAGELVALRHGSGEGMTVDLLYFNDGTRTHYMLITNFNGLMRYRTKYKNSMFFCKKCLHGFTSRILQAFHSKSCKQGLYQRIEMPPPGVIKFKNFHKQQKRPFAIYCDFECLTKPLDSCSPNPEYSYTSPYQRHVPCSYSIVTCSELDYDVETVEFAHEDPELVSRSFIEDLNRIYEDMEACYKENTFEIHMSVEDEKKYKKSRKCHICSEKLDWKAKKNWPVRDHDHYKPTDNFRGAAHR